MSDAPNTQPLHCPTCYSTDFQASRLRPEDRLQLLTFKLPIRCRNCNARVYASRSYVKTLVKAGHRTGGTKHVAAESPD